MMDVSDGLAKDLHALTPPGLWPALEAARIPRRAGADLRAALTDGEDYELVFVVDRATDPSSFIRRWQRNFPRTRLSRFGCFVPRGKVPPGTVSLDQFRGYEHLR